MSKQWKLSWMMWPHEWPAPARSEAIHDSEDAMREQLNGLKSMEAPHAPRPCGKHVWDISVEERTTSDWESSDG